MKLTIKQLLTSIVTGALPRLITDPDYSLKVKYSLKDVWKQVIEHRDRYDEMRIDLCKKYAELKPTKANLEVSEYQFETEGKKAQFEADIQELQLTEIEITGRTYTLADITKPLGKPDTLTGEDFYALDWLICEAPDALDDAIVEEKVKAAVAGSGDLLEIHE